MVIYKISNTINNKVYIGQTIKTIKKRWSEHCNLTGYMSVIKSAIHKYGKDNFTIEIIATANSIEELNQLEKDCILQYNSISPNGYNIREGGENGKHSELTKRKISLANSGQLNGMYGKKLSNEIKEQISQKLKGRPARNKGISPSDSTILKMKGRTPWNKGKTLSKETCRKISEIQCKQVLCLNNNVIYSSTKHAAKELNCTQSKVSAVCLNQQPQTKGFRFQYVKDQK